jgi:hypothetical protein
MANNKEWLPTEKNIEEYGLLNSMLESQKKEFDSLSGKKPTEQLSLFKIKMANRVLEPLKELFKHEESYKFLDLLEEENIPTYSDVVLIISQYKTAISKFESKYFTDDEFQHNAYGSPVVRWMTDECPPDYYDDEKDE